MACAPGPSPQSFDLDRVWPKAAAGGDLRAPSVQEATRSPPSRPRSADAQDVERLLPSLPSLPLSTTV